jgi:hypothetical protein
VAREAATSNGLGTDGTRSPAVRHLRIAGPVGGLPTTSQPGEIKKVGQACRCCVGATHGRGFDSRRLHLRLSTSSGTPLASVVRTGDACAARPRYREPQGHEARADEGPSPRWQPVLRHTGHRDDPQRPRNSSDRCAARSPSRELSTRFRSTGLSRRSRLVTQVSPKSARDQGCYKTPVKPGERTLAQASFATATTLDTSDTNTLRSCAQRVEWRNIAS